VPLPPFDPDRIPLHRRSVDLQGFRRRDGLYEVEARMTDTTVPPPPEGGGGVPGGGSIGAAAGARVKHDMWIRIVFDRELLVRDVVASTDAAPHAVCAEAAPSLASLVGLTMGAGWTRTVRERLGGARGCTHLTELLGPVATTAFQTLAPVRMAAPVRIDAAGRPTKIDSCHAYSRRGELVRSRWPDFHEPGDPPAGDPQASDKEPVR
jgi:hypothetical protein